MFYLFWYPLTAALATTQPELSSDDVTNFKLSRRNKCSVKWELLMSPFSAVTVFRRQNLTSKDGPRNERVLWNISCVGDFLQQPFLNPYTLIVIITANGQHGIAFRYAILNKIYTCLEGLVRIILTVQFIYFYLTSGLAWQLIIYIFI